MNDEIFSSSRSQEVHEKGKYAQTIRIFYVNV